MNPESSRPELAIVGIGCLFPQADGLGGYWANVKHAVDCITEVPATHWNPDDYFDADPKSPDMTYARRGGFLSAHDFNPLEYGIAPRDIEATDTAQLLGLVAAKRALDDAGIDLSSGRLPKDVDRTRFGVILGVTGTLELVVPLGARLGHPKWKQAMRDAGIPEDAVEDASSRIAESYVPWQENSFPGLLGNVVAGRIANRLDLGGTNCVVDAACASSLSAVHLAAMELQTGRADVIVTGGADTFNDIFMYMCFSKTPALSPTGNAKPFDSQSDGTILGEGIGMVVLKRRADAERDGNRIYAILKGIGSSSDGKGSAIYAPVASGQKHAILNAYNDAGVSPHTIELVEAHGTGTKVGDAVEVSALKDVYGSAANGNVRPWCALGSVKSQIGHTKAAAGAASLIKTALALHFKVLPPTVKVAQPAAALQDSDSPFYVNTTMRPWLPSEKHPRRAALSAFGFGGSNFHAVLEEASPTKTETDWDGHVQLLALSGDSALSLVEKLPESTDRNSFARAAVESRSSFDASANCRLVVVAHRTLTDLPKLLQQVRMKLKSESQAWELKEGAYFGTGTPGKLAVLFPGQGSQSVGMLRELACTFPEMLEALTQASFSPLPWGRGAGGEGESALSTPKISSNEASSSPSPPTPLPAGERGERGQLSDVIYPPPAFDAETLTRQEDALRATDIAQPAIGAVSWGAYTLLKERFGIEADAFAGHSYGELPALAAAEAISVDDFVKLSQQRGALMAAQRSGDPGTMLAVLAPIDKIEAVVEQHNLDVVLANRNAPEQTVLSGSTAEIQRAEKALTQASIRSVSLKVAAAFHSPLVADAAQPFREMLGRINFTPPAKPVFANSTGQAYPDDATAMRDLLGYQLQEPVRFVEELQAMAELGCRTFIEVGPGIVLSKLVNATLPDAHAIALDGLTRSQPDLLKLGHLLSKLAALGYNVQLSSWEAESRCRPALPASPHAVPVCGANAVLPRPKRPASPALTPNSTPPHGTSMSDSQNSNSSQGVRQALELTQQTLAALQKMQEDTARLHQQFLHTQEQAQSTLTQLVAQQQALFFGTTPPAMPAPPPSVPAVAKVHAPAPPPPTPEPEPAMTTQIYPFIESIDPEPTPVAKSSSNVVEETLLEVVAEKTGYPREMLNLEMSLDADLGIDSIKRVEILSTLQEKLPEAPVVKPEHLGTLHTLQDVAEFLFHDAGESTPIVNESVSFDVKHPPSVSDTDMDISLPSVGSDFDHVSAMLLEVVAEKTGYPREMLNLEMSLDADLGIDSIKRVEILSTLQEKLPDAPVVKPEHLGTLHTLQDVAGFLSAEPTSTKSIMSEPATSNALPDFDLHLMATTQNVPVVPMKRRANVIDSELAELLTPRTEALPEIPAVPGRLSAVPGVEQIQLKQVDRSILQAVDLDHSRARPRIPLIEGGLIWLLAEDDKLSHEMIRCLRDEGHEVERFDWELPPSRELKQPAGLVIVAPEQPESLPLNRIAFAWLQKAGPQLRSLARHSASAVVVTVARLDGVFGLGELDPNTDPQSGGLAGLVKTAAYEWSELSLKAIDIDPKLVAQDHVKAAETIVAELSIAGPIEVGITATHLSTLELARTIRREMNSKPLFNSDDVVLVTGGARGVTAEIAVTLAEFSQPTMVLTGRTAAPSEPEPDWLHGLSDEAEIKRAIAAHLGSSATPKAVGDFFIRTQAQRQIRATMKRIEKTGARVAYYAVNVADGKQVANLLHQVHVKHGAITGLVHGAGVLADRRIDDLTLEQFDRVYSTKVGGLQHFLELLDDHELKAMLLFSSTTARFGRVGQVAYACANEVLNKTAAVEARRRPNARVVAINWGPWDGGMVTPGLRKLFETEGIGLIPMEEGGVFAVQELASMNSAVEVVALGKPATRQQRSGVTPFPQPSTPANGELPGRVSAPPLTSPPAGLSLVFERTVNAQTHPVLLAHVLDSRIVVPMALHMEWLAHAALHGNPGLVFHGFNDLRITHGIMVEAEMTATIRAFAGKAVKQEKLFIVSVELRGKRKDGREMLHSRAEVVLCAALPQAPSALPDPHVEPYPHSIEKVYRHFLFHGPDFQSIERIDGMTETAILAKATPSPSPTEWFEEPLRSSWVAEPLILDASFQLMILWCYAHHGNGSLPCFTGRYRQYRRAFPMGSVRLVLRITRDNGTFARADIDFLDTDDAVIARISDYECVIDRQLDSAFRRNQLVVRSS